MSLISLGFLLVTLVAMTAVTSNTKQKQLLTPKASYYCNMCMQDCLTTLSGPDEDQSRCDSLCETQCNSGGSETGGPAPAPPAVPTPVQPVNQPEKTPSQTRVNTGRCPNGALAPDGDVALCPSTSTTTKTIPAQPVNTNTTSNATSQNTSTQDGTCLEPGQTCASNNYYTDHGCPVTETRCGVQPSNTGNTSAGAAAGTQPSTTTTTITTRQLCLAEEGIWENGRCRFPAADSSVSNTTSTCTPNCACTASTYRGSTCSNGCGGVCSGSLPTGTDTQSTSSAPTCTGTCRWGVSSCADGGWQTAPGSCQTGAPAVCCGGTLVDHCSQGLIYCVNSSTVAVCKIDKSGYTNTPCANGTVCDSGQNRCVATSAAPASQEEGRYTQQLILPPPTLTPVTITRSDYQKCLDSGNTPTECSSITQNIGKAVITTPTAELYPQTTNNLTPSGHDVYQICSYQPDLPNCLRIIEPSILTIAQAPQEESKSTISNPSIPFLTPNIQNIDYQNCTPEINGSCNFSENYKPASEGTFANKQVVPTMIIIHWDENKRTDPNQWLTSTTYNGLEGNNTSAHFAVGADGVLQMLPTYDQTVTVSYGATGYYNAINIEFAGYDFNNNPPTKNEVESGIELITNLCQQYNIPPAEIFGHYQKNSFIYTSGQFEPCSPTDPQCMIGGKTDPSPEFMQYMVSEVEKRLGVTTSLNLTGTILQ